MNEGKKVNKSIFQCGLKQLILFTMLFLITSCKIDEKLPQRTNTQTDNSRQWNTNIDLSKMTRFERAVYNSWNDLSEEDKTFFKQCLIGDTTQLKK